MSLFVPRDYQMMAIDATLNYLKQSTGNPVVAMPTGTGKSVVIGGTVCSVIAQQPRAKVIMLTHIKELVEQNTERLLSLWPQAPVGIVNAGLKGSDLAKRLGGHTNPQAQIVYGSIQTAKSYPALFGHVDYCLIDEAHLVPPRADGEYIQFLNELTARNPALRVCGYSATQFRMGQGMLTDPMPDDQGIDRRVFTECVMDQTTAEWFGWFIANGHLVYLIPKRTETEIPVNAVPLASTGDYALGALERATIDPRIIEPALDEGCQLGMDRRSWLAFCPGIESCEYVAEGLRRRGISAAAVHSKMQNREQVIEDFRRGNYRCLTTNNVLTTGFDHPPVDFILMLRATTSPGLWVQMCGRGMRPSPNKQNCLVADFARNARRLGPIDDPRIPKRKGKGDGLIPVKECESCGAYNHISARACIDCGAPFEIETKVQKFADTANIMSDDTPKVEKFDVSVARYTEHLRKRDGRMIIRVDYICKSKTNRRFSEYLDFDKMPENKIYFIANEWWKQRFPMGVETPLSNEEAMLRIDGARVPYTVTVHTNIEFPRIVGHGFQKY